MILTIQDQFGPPQFALKQSNCTAMVPKLYMMPPSPPVRAVLMTAKSLNLNLELIEVNTFKGEQLKPEFIKINPQHTVPTLVDDDGFTIWDSHAIMAYLVSKYGKDDSLYPKDLQKRAVIDQRLHFDSSVIFSRIISILKPLMYGNGKTIEQHKLDAVIEVYGFLEAFLKDKWMASDSITIADFGLINSVETLDVILPINKDKFPRLADWVKRVEALPEYEVSKKGYEMLVQVIKSRFN